MGTAYCIRLNMIKILHMYQVTKIKWFLHYSLEDHCCTCGSSPPPPHMTALTHRREQYGRLRLKCDGTRIFRRNGRVQLNRPVGRQFSQLLTAEVCPSAVAMLDKPCFEVVWRVLAIHSIRQFPLYFPSRASPCAITFPLGPTEASMWPRYASAQDVKSCTSQASYVGCGRFKLVWETHFEVNLNLHEMCTRRLRSN